MGVITFKDVRGKQRSSREEEMMQEPTYFQKPMDVCHDAKGQLVDFFVVQLTCFRIGLLLTERPIDDASVLLDTFLGHVALGDEDKAGSVYKCWLYRARLAFRSTNEELLDSVIGASEAEHRWFGEPLGGDVARMAQVLAEHTQEEPAEEVSLEELPLFAFAVSA